MTSLKTNLFNLVRSTLKIKIFEKVIRLFCKGKPTSHFISKLCPNNYQYKLGTIRNFNHNGIELEVDIHDYVGHFLYFGFKDTSHEALYSLINENDNIIDVGTNIGSTILQFTNLSGEESRIIGFEPDPVNFKNCQKNISLNKFKNIQVFSEGLGNEKGSFQLIVDEPSNRGMNRVSIENQPGKSSAMINIETLDSIINREKINRINIVKIDVEGFEMNVLKGAVKLVESQSPIFFIEIDDNNLKKAGSSSLELITFLIQMKYHIFIAEDNKQIDTNYNFLNCHFDIIAKPNQNYY